MAGNGLQQRGLAGRSGRKMLLLLLQCELLLLSLHVSQTDAQLLLKPPGLPDPLKAMLARLRAFLTPKSAGPVTVLPGANLATVSISSTSKSRQAAGKCSRGDWGLSAIGAADATAAAGLPSSTERVLICLISTGVQRDAPAVSHNRWSGCAPQDSLDPAGCMLPWATSPAAQGFRPRGTWAASIIAGRGLGVIPDGADIHVVPVDGPASGSLDPGSLAPSGKSRLRAYSVCEGRLRGLQAQDFGSGGVRKPARWRMVMLVDVTADKPASTGSSAFTLNEADWVAEATGPGAGEAAHTPDVLVIAPAGARTSVSYPAALPGVLGVGAVKCSGEAAVPAAASGERGTAAKPDLLAPGVNIAVGSDGAAWSDSAASAAFVAGAAARLWSAFPRCGADVIRQALLSGDGKAQPPRLSLPAAAAALRKLDCAATV